MLKASVSWFDFTLAKKGEEKKKTVCSYSLPGEQACGVRSSMNTCSSIQYFSYTQNQQPKCFCLGDMFSNELDKNYRCTLSDVIGGYLHRWFTVQPISLIGTNSCHVYVLCSVQGANDWVACKIVSLKLVPQVLQQHEGSQTSVFHLGTSMCETCDYIDMTTHL